MVGLLGKKIGMTQVFGEDGRVTPATAIQAGPCFVLQVKSAERDGYYAVKVGFDEQKESRVNKPLRGIFKKAGISAKKFIREFSIEPGQEYKVGEKIPLDIFSVGEFVDITGVSIGKGFQGGMKRWHWKGGGKTHGSMSHRRPGSIGASSDPSRVLKGKHLPGHMGNRRVTVQNLKVLKVDAENNLILVKGAVPGHRNSYLVIKSAKKSTLRGNSRKRFLAPKE
jgi:large subunit ribosomal protein L3